MKKNLLYILLFAMSLTSCGDFLELYPKTQLNDGDFYKTEDDVKMGLYGLMNTLQHSVDNIYSTFIYMSDEGDTGGGPGEGGYGLDLFQFDSNNCPNWWGGEWNLGMTKALGAPEFVADLVSKFVHASGLKSLSHAWYSTIICLSVMNSSY